MNGWIHDGAHSLLKEPMKVRYMLEPSAIPEVLL